MSPGRRSSPRNAMIHVYERVSLEEVWRMAAVDVPVLAEQIESLIPPTAPEQT